jgi:hypothetical protein
MQTGLQEDVMMKTKGSRLAVAVLAAFLAVPVGPLAANYAAAQDAQPAAAAPAQSTQVPQPDSGVNWPGAGYGAAALLGNVLYIPAKLVYALLGGFVGGGTWLLTGGNTQAADTVWRSSLGGDYVLTPQMVAGEQPINFSGPTETPPAPTTADASSPPITAGGSGVSTVQPITPIPPSAAAASGTSASSTAIGAHPMDSGTGPVGGATRRGGSPMDNTSIE